VFAARLLDGLVPREREVCEFAWPRALVTDVDVLSGLASAFDSPFSGEPLLLPCD
jgi:hypothetical protein